ncbi:MAG: UDP-N-acetylmuramoyl-L-alanine--D-glutamate ligase [Acidobacteriota bacterium]|nr:UDP-N-acetylmuramoyl-L-alanine--D-glutamate ligase [Acidobacteriota bacterium]MDH3522005.1 UDP-N-acetylmuramoyl-L-alanine--D-glutamate ligase [Acidobacteriota bacterium]
MKAPWSNGEWHRVLVYGLGVSGRAALRFLRRRGVAVLAVDDRDPALLEPPVAADDSGVRVARAGDVARLPADVDGVVVSPGVPPDRPLLLAARARALPVIGEVELAFPFLAGPVVAITGSNGKSTTTALTGRMLAAAGRGAVVCGNIGRPLVDCVDDGGEMFVAELSSYQLESVDTFRPRAAALLNLSPDHLDRHGTLAAYVAAKARIFENQRAGDVAVFNADDPLVTEVAARTERPRRRFFSRRAAVADGCFVESGVVVEVAPGEEARSLFSPRDVPVPGAHNLENAMASALLARAMGARAEHLAAGLAAFEGLPHRVQKVLERGGTAWFDDSKGTNVGATSRSLEGFADGSVHLILGGRGKGADLGVLRDVVRRKARRLYLIGESAPDFARALGGVVEAETAGSLDRAVAAAARRAAAGEVVLLSPACSSFDQYDNYMRRGEHFQRLVRELAGTEAADG